MNLQRIDPLLINQRSSGNKNLNFPLINFHFCPIARYIKVTETSISFHHDEKDSRFALLDPYFKTEEMEKIKEAAKLNIDALYSELNQIDLYLKYIPGIGNIVNLMALRPNVLEFIGKILSLKEKSNVPILLMKQSLEGKTPIDIACE